MSENLSRHPTGSPPEPPVARARLQQDRPRTTRPAIIDAAEVLWSEKDFDSVPMEDVCQKAGVAKGTFYFPRKEHLLVMLAFSRTLLREAQLKTLLEGDLGAAGAARAGDQAEGQGQDRRLARVQVSAASLADAKLQSPAMPRPHSAARA